MKKSLAGIFIPHPENHVCKDIDEWFSGGIPLHERKTEQSETTAVKQWSFISRVFFCLVLCGSVLFSGAKAQQAEKKEERNPNKSTSSLPMAGSQDKSGVFVSREGERYYPEKSTFKSQAGQQDSSGVLISREGERHSSESQAGNQTQITLPKDQQPLSGDKNKAIAPQAEEKVFIEQKVNMEGKKPAGGQPQSSQAGSKKQGKPSLKNAVAPKGSRGAGVKR